MVGPGRHSKGGVAAVIETLSASSLADRFRLVWVETHRDGSGLGKAAQGLVGFLQIGGWFLSRRVDLVYIHASSRWSLRRKAVIASLARLFRYPYVIHVHGARFHHYYDGAGERERRLVRAVLSHADVVIALSPVWEERLREIAPCRTAVVPNPVPLPEHPGRPSEATASVVSLGRLGERKGSLTLVRALADLSSTYPQATLVLAGDGETEAVQAEAVRLGVDGRVELPGWVDAAERMRLLGTATVFALPSRDEGLPVSLLEAMASGLPVVVSQAGGIPDVVRDGEHGLFVAPDDPEGLARAIARLFADPEYAASLGAAGRREIASRHETEVVAERMKKILASCLARRA